jgi:uncharacterized protein YbcI
MSQLESNISKELAELASALQEQRTGHAPTAVTVVLSEDTLVVTLHNALTLAEKALAKRPAGAAHVQEFHRQLFASSMNEMRQEIQRIMGRQVRESAAEVETATGTVIHAFTTGAMVQVFLLVPGSLPDATANDGSDGASRADDDGLRVAPENNFVKR